MKPLPGKNPTHNGLPSDIESAGSAPVTPEVDIADEEGRFLSPGNAIMLLLMVSLFLYLLYKFTFDEMWSIAKATLGLSFIIFVHELGHFLAAKWCGVNVTTFSIGFGPAIPGCRVKWGETTYKMAILPLGGYVQMVGQVDGDEASDGSDDDPRSYRRKTVGQRMLIISAGVIMNAVLAILCFITVYKGEGKEHPAAVINWVDSGAPAFQKGLPSGAQVLEIDNIKDPTFTDLTQSVINSMASEPIPLIYQVSGKPPVSLSLLPRKTSSDTKPVFGVAPPPRLQAVKKGDSLEGPYWAGTTAAHSGLEFGDLIVSMTDCDDPAQASNYDPKRLKELPDDPRFPGHGQRDYFEFARRMQLLAGKDIIIRVRRTEKKDTREVDLTLAPMYRLDLGVRMEMGPVLVIREGSPADGKVLAPTTGEKKRRGDVIEAVSVTTAEGKKLSFKRDFKADNAANANDLEQPLDPERLPLQLKQWSDSLERAHFKGDRKVTLYLSRQREGPGPDQETVAVEIPWDGSFRFDRAAPISINSGLPIPELGIAYQVKSMVENVTHPGSKLKKGDVIKNVRYEVEGFKEETPWLRRMMEGSPGETKDIKLRFMDEDLEEGQWANISFEYFQKPYNFKKLVLRIERDKKVEEVEIPITLDKSWPLNERGWLLSRDTRRIRAADSLDAVRMGFVDTKNRMTEVFLNLRGMILGRISVKNLGGPLTIAYGAYRFAGLDFSDFVWFLGLISINLAVVNFLPIPVLDGGHMVLLIYEKLRGQPASEGVRVVATYVGLFMILCLMIFVLSLDAIRIFFSA